VERFPGERGAGAIAPLGVDACNVAEELEYARVPAGVVDTGAPAQGQ